MGKLLLLFYNYFMNLSLLAGFAALEQTAKTDKVISVGIVNKGMIWCLSLTLRWINNNCFTLTLWTKARLISGGHTQVTINGSMLCASVRCRCIWPSVGPMRSQRGESYTHVKYSNANILYKSTWKVTPNTVSIHSFSSILPQIEH